MYQEKVQDVEQKIQLLSQGSCVTVLSTDTRDVMKDQGVFLPFLITDTAPEFQAPVKDLDLALQKKLDMAVFLHDCQVRADCFLCVNNHKSIPFLFQSESAQNKFDQEMQSLELNFEVSLSI